MKKHQEYRRNSLLRKYDKKTTIVDIGTYYSVLERVLDWEAKNANKGIRKRNMRKAFKLIWSI